jgi:hypothetical protein
VARETETKLYLGRIANEEDRGVVADQIPVPFFGIKLHGKTSRITNSICRALFTSYGGEADKDRSAFANAIEEFSLAISVEASIKRGIKSSCLCTW